MRLTIVYEPATHSTGGSRYALDEDGRWWEDDSRRCGLFRTARVEPRWKPVRQRYRSKPCLNGSLSPDVDGPWIEGS